MIIFWFDKIYFLSSFRMNNFYLNNILLLSINLHDAENTIPGFNMNILCKELVKLIDKISLIIVKVL